MELLEARAVLVEEEATRAAALEESTGAREASLKALQEKASPRHSVSIVAPVIAWVYRKYSMAPRYSCLRTKMLGLLCFGFEEADFRRVPVDGLRDYPTVPGGHTKHHAKYSKLPPFEKYVNV